MGDLLKVIAMILVAVLQAAGGTVAPLEVLGLVVLAALWVIQEKYCRHLILIALEYVLIFALGFISPFILILCGVLAFDLAGRGLYWQVLLLLPAGIYHLEGERLGAYAVLLALCASSGYLSHILSVRKESFRVVYDRERRNRYALEEARAQLLASTREAARLAEIQERNRIAREIHDHLGHRLAGILLQLQAAVKALDRDEEKARELFKKSVTGLAQSLDLLRDTVYNIRPRDQLGVEYFQQIIDDFQFCPVKFSPRGDIASLTAAQTETLASIVKEALTNASRHSRATQVEVQLEVREKIVRLYFRDNGVGSAKIHEGMGLIGMRERARNAGGTISFNPEGGFQIVCVLPRDKQGKNLAGGW